MSARNSPFRTFRALLRPLLLFAPPRKLEDLALFARHLEGAMAVRAPIPAMLRAFADESDSGPLARAVRKVAERVEDGTGLASALDEDPEAFPGSFRRLVRLGEETRSLDRMMASLAESLERALGIHEHVRRAALYPLLVLAVLFFNTIFLAHKVLPRFVAIYEELGFGWPEATSRNAMIAMDAIGALLLVLIAYVVAAALGLRIRFVNYGKLPLELPLVGPVLRLAETAKFANHLALLTENRVPMAEALGLLAESSENSYVRAAIRDFQRRYSEGERLSELVASQPLFPPSVGTLIAGAEEQGNLPEALRNLGRFYGERTTNGLLAIKELFGPIIILMTGILVSLVVAAVYMPLFQIPRMVAY